METDHLEHEGIPYPGGYVPAEGTDRIAEIIQAAGTETIPPRVNMTETRDGYKIELEAPGQRKEDFIIQADQNILSIFADNRHGELAAGECYLLHEFTHRYLRRDIVLPPDVNTLFTHTEYQAGILTIYLGKMQHHPDDLRTVARVY